MGKSAESATVGERIAYLFANTMPEECSKANVSVDTVRTIFNMLRPKLDEAKNNLPPAGYSNISPLVHMYNVMDRIDDKKVEQPHRWMLPSRSLSEKAWAGALSKIQDSEGLDMNETEMQALRKVNYNGVCGVHILSCRKPALLCSGTYKLPIRP